MRKPERRKGAVLVVVTLFMLVLLGFMALAIDFSYMYEVKFELKRAVDAAALAGASALKSKTAAEARQQAYDILQKNKIFEKYDIDCNVNEDIVLGYWQDGEFVACGDDEHPTTIRITARPMNEEGTVDFFFGRLFGKEHVAMEETSVAEQPPLSVILALDVSGSMTKMTEIATWRNAPRKDVLFRHYACFGPTSSLKYFQQNLKYLGDISKNNNTYMYGLNMHARWSFQPQNTPWDDPVTGQPAVKFLYYDNRTTTVPDGSVGPYPGRNCPLDWDLINTFPTVVTLPNGDTYPVATQRDYIHAMVGEPEPLQTEKSAFVSFVDMIEDDAVVNKHDVSLVTFGTSVTTVIDYATGYDDVRNQIDSQWIPGMNTLTNTRGALQRAQSLALNRPNQGYKPIVLLISDGKPTTGGTESQCVTTATAMGQQGIIVYTIGVCLSTPWYSAGESATAKKCLQDISAATSGHMYDITVTEDQFNAWSEVQMRQFLKAQMEGAVKDAFERIPCRLVK